MKIAVLIKQVPDPNAVRFDQSAGGVPPGLPQMVNEYDLYGVEAAVQLAESRGDVEIVVASVGPAKDALNRCLAMGANRAVSIDLPSDAADSLVTATLLTAWVQRESFDLILLGQETSDGGTGNVGPHLAALLDLPLVSNVVDLAFEGDSLTLKREIEDGRQVVSVQPPAVLCALTGLNEPRYPSLKGIMAARKKETQTLGASDLVSDSSQLTPVVAWGSLGVEEQASGGTILEDVAPADAVEQLVAFLQERKLI